MTRFRRRSSAPATSSSIPVSPEALPEPSPRSSFALPVLAAWAALTCALLVSPALPLRAQEPEAVPELVTDRPDQTESATVVPPGLVQLETGALWTRDDQGRLSVDTTEAPGTLLRIGLVPKVELRLGWAGDVEEEAEISGRDIGEVSGLGDAEVGAKVHLARERGRRPRTALLVGVSVPVGDDEVSSERFDPSFRFAFAHTLTERISLGYNVGMAWSSELTAPEERETFSFGQYTAALGFGLSERWGAFVEVFGDVPVDAPGGTESSVDGGFTFLVREHLQLDVSAGVGLSESAPDEFLGLGLSVRLPY